MNNDESSTLTEEDIVRLARTFRQPLPEGYMEELMAKIDAPERTKKAEPYVTPEMEEAPDGDIEEEINEDIEDDIEP